MVGSVPLDFGGIQESCLGFIVGTEEKQSISSEHTLLLAPSAADTQKGEVRWCQGDEILSTFLC